MARRPLEWIWGWGPAVAYLALIFVLSSLPLRGLGPSPFTAADKLIHAVEFGLLCGLLFRGLRLSRIRWLFRWAPLVALVLASLYGALDEWHQGFSGRDPDFGDWLADTVGAALVAAGLMAYTELHKEPES